MKVNVGESFGASSTDPDVSRMDLSKSIQRSDPKEGELCLYRVKPEETLVEARSGSDVQIDRQIWAWGRKTNRTI